MAYITLGNRMINTDTIVDAQLLSTYSSTVVIADNRGNDTYVSCANNAAARDCLERIAMAKNGIIHSAPSRSTNAPVQRLETADQMRARLAREQDARNAAIIGKGIADLISLFIK